MYSIMILMVKYFPKTEFYLILIALDSKPLFLLGSIASALMKRKLFGTEEEHVIL